MLLFEVETIAAPVWAGAVDAPPPPPYPPYPFPPAFAPPVVAPGLVVPELDPPELELLLPHPAASAPTAASATSPSSGRRANPNLVGRESPVGRVASVRCNNALTPNHLRTTFPFLHGADPVPRSDRNLWPRRLLNGPAAVPSGQAEPRSGHRIVVHPVSGPARSSKTSYAAPRFPADRHASFVRILGAHLHLPGWSMIATAPTLRLTVNRQER